MTDHDDRAMLKRMFPKHAERIEAADLAPLVEGIRRNLSSSVPELHQALAPGRQNMLGLLSTPSALPMVGKALEEAPKGWQKPLAVNAFSSTLGLTPRLNFPTAAVPMLGVSPAIKVATIDWAALQCRDERALRFAAQNNWFIQPESRYPITADIDACSGDLQALDKLFTEETRELQSQIQARLTDDHPTRAPMIDEMFRLHNEQRYLASIPLALICAEGLAYEVAEESIDNLNKNRPAIAGWLDKQQLSGLAKELMASLSEQHPLSKPRKGKLSRHLVLHGRDCNYGSELFSLQAISLLGFVGWAFAADGPAAKSGKTTTQIMPLLFCPGASAYVRVTLGPRWKSAGQCPGSCDAIGRRPFRLSAYPLSQHIPLVLHTQCG